MNVAQTSLIDRTTHSADVLLLLLFFVAAVLSSP